MRIGWPALALLGVLLTGCGSEWLQVDAGTNWTCGSDEDNELRCWGAVDTFLEPPSGAFTSLSIGTNHGCALNAAGAVGC